MGDFFPPDGNVLQENKHQPKALTSSKTELAGGFFSQGTVHKKNIPCKWPNSKLYKIPFFERK